MTTTPPVPITFGDLTVKVANELQSESSELFGDSILSTTSSFAFNPAATSYGQFPQIAADAERMILTRLDVLNLHIYADINLSVLVPAGQNAYIAIPNDCVVIRYVELFEPAGAVPSQDSSTTFQGTDQLSGNIIQLRRRDETALRDWTRNLSLSGEPRYYAILGAARDASAPNGQLFLAPTPNKNYNVRMGYTGWPTPLSPANPTSYLSQWMPTLLFYACMVRASAYTKAPQAAMLWKQLYDEHMVDTINLEARRKAEGYSDASRTTAPMRERNQ